MTEIKCPFCGSTDLKEEEPVEYGYGMWKHISYRKSCNKDHGNGTSKILIPYYPEVKRD